MVLVSMSRKTASFRQLAEYILDPKKAVKEKDGSVFTFLHNLKGKSVDEIVKAFKANESNRATSLRKNSNLLYHEVMSWHAKDGHILDTATIRALVERYVNLRNPNALFMGAVHGDTQSKHFHCMVSGIEAISGLSSRLSTYDMEKMKKELTAYEQELGLQYSYVEHGKHSMRTNNREYQLEKRDGKPSRKKEIESMLEKAFEDSMSKKEFYEKLQKEHGLSTYERGGKVAGIDDGRHLRFSTLGYDDSKLVELDVREERIRDMEEAKQVIMEQEVDVEMKDNEVENTGDGWEKDYGDEGLGVG